MPTTNYSKKPTNRKGVGNDQWNENDEGTEQTMNFDRDDSLENDLFAQRMLEFID